jgi:uncharacterized membrane protein SpoIIM required for sporulation
MLNQPLNINDFIKLREKDWERLQTLLEKSRGRSSLTAAEVRELGDLYRAASSDLAVAQRDYPGQRVTAFLNQLLARGHGALYQEDVSDPRQLLRFITHTIPQTFRETWQFTLVAFLLFIIPAAVGFRIAYTTPDTLARSLGLTDLQQTLANSDIWTEIPVEQRPAASAFIMSNNIRIAILAFGAGVSFGLVTVYILITNGLVIGGVLGMAYHYGMGNDLLGFVVGHGVIELSIIFIAGGAGLQLGWAMLNPGRYSRRDALTLAARRAIALAVLAVPFLILAGMIEGFLSPSDIPTPFWLRLLVGLGSGALMYAYLLLSGRARAVVLPALGMPGKEAHMRG